MIDLHSHILPGLDDGVADLEGSLALASAAVAAGVTVIAATPHVRSDFPTSPGQMLAALAQLRRELAGHAIGLDVVQGGEVALERLAGLDDESLEAFSIAGTGAYLLVEFPYEGWSRGGELALAGLVSRGVTPILAHPERNPSVQDDPSMLERLLAATGARVQVTISSLAGQWGRGASSCAASLLRRGLVDILASDAHSASRGTAAWEVPAETDARITAPLTVATPRAVVEGRALPGRGAGRVGLSGIRRRRWRRR